MMLKFGFAPSGWLAFAGVVTFLVGCSSSHLARQQTRGEASRPSTGAERLEGLDLNGRPVNPLNEPRAKAVTLIFVRTDCPISNHYAPEIQRLYKKFRALGVAFWLVYPNDTTSVAEIQAHDREYGLSLPVLRDPRHRLVQKTGVRVTPEATVFLPGGEMVYRGRIDDQYVDLGKQRSEATEHDLDVTLAQLVAGKPVTNAETVAVGCYISGL
ncbi:MAG TPA: redoxin domain-containing protein [Candidatus Acidoferrum sp.]|jgi:hypothetical protein|nr:redoxin domain-containing protein [Candidatus Acidoferrum sp.]